MYIDQLTNTIRSLNISQVQQRNTNPIKLYSSRRAPYFLAMDSHLLSTQTGSTWTNEKHLHFLNAMESSFVHKMLQTNAHRLRLDRYLPDSSESTLDLKTHRRKKHAFSVDHAVGSKTKIGGKVDKRTRRPSSRSQPCNSAQDQVVPQLGNREDEQD
ncbi:hypothetical protein HS088_TW19G00748 [Tripterygium wilfordii]|uniref:Uncharacterized protein n=1 Tax=Tripterygium wilfordii TaxID=458696 RepID=A0A7J7CAI6_TRIWF|nr:uncharacterized protein LOC119986024 [Tripterygium wilfordii]KAF5731143.1 hypothetical protein HS088_TW19G00748 [Tripterygium wilfordii]